MKLEAQTRNLSPQACDLCGESATQPVLLTPRLDGPLVRCRGCGLHYVIRTEMIPPPASVPVASTDLPLNSTSHHVAEEMLRLARRARELELVEPEIEQRESLWREMTAQERLSDLRRFVKGGRLLEIGCSTGDLLSVANGSFNSTGVEADLAAGSVARARGIDCFSGTLFDARFNHEEFDLAAMYHVIEHLPSPRQTLQEINRIVQRNGWLVIETPNIATPWVRLLGPRWRQFIPDHLYFFAPETITRLCHETGFEIRELRSVGKAMSVRLFLSRLGRYHKGLARGFAALSHQLGMNERTLRLNLGDVMRIYAQKR